MYDSYRGWVRRSDWTDRLYYELRHDNNAPPLPKAGLYTVKEKKLVYGNWLDDESKRGKPYTELYISHNPKDEIWTGGWGCDGEYRERRKSISWKIHKDDSFILAYDQINLNDINFYLYNPTDRVHYLDMIPLLLELKKQLENELLEEQGFKNLVLQDMKLGEDIRPLVDKAVEWYKLEIATVWKRPITKDTPKAFSMVKKRVKYYQKEQRLAKKKKPVKKELSRTEWEARQKVAAANKVPDLRSPWEIFKGVRYEYVKATYSYITFKTLHVTPMETKILETFFSQLLSDKFSISSGYVNNGKEVGFWSNMCWSIAIQRNDENDFWQSLERQDPRSRLKWWLARPQQLFKLTKEQYDEGLTLYI